MATTDIKTPVYFENDGWVFRCDGFGYSATGNRCITGEAIMRRHAHIGFHKTWGNIYSSPDKPESMRLSTEELNERLDAIVGDLEDLESKYRRMLNS